MILYSLNLVSPDSLPNKVVSAEVSFFRKVTLLLATLIAFNKVNDCNGPVVPACVCAYVHVCASVCMYACALVCVCVCTCVCKYLCVCMCTCVCALVHTCILHMCIFSCLWGPKDNLRYHSPERVLIGFVFFPFLHFI